MLCACCLFGFSELLHRGLKLYFLWVVVGWGSLGAPYLWLHVGGSEGRAGFVLCGVFLRLDAWVRILYRAVVLVWLVTCICHRGPPRFHFVAR